MEALFDRKLFLPNPDESDQNARMEVHLHVHINRSAVVLLENAGDVLHASLAVETASGSAWQAVDRTLVPKGSHVEHPADSIAVFHR